MIADIQTVLYRSDRELGSILKILLIQLSKREEYLLDNQRNQDENIDKIIAPKETVRYTQAVIT